VIEIDFEDGDEASDKTVQNYKMGLRVRRQPAKPRPVKPRSIIAHVAGSGMAGVKSPVVPMS
jgi:hypothetical protein